jgi:hypothetical protein
MNSNRADGTGAGYVLDVRGLEFELYSFIYIYIYSYEFSPLYVLSRPVIAPNQPPIQRIPVRESLKGIIPSGREADNSSSFNVKLKKMWVYTSTPSYVLMV